MNKLGIAFSDITGAYVACAIKRKRPDIDLTLLYDPAAEVKDFLTGTEERMGSMGITRYLTVYPVRTEGVRDYYREVLDLKEADLQLDLGESFDTQLLYFTVLDGLFQRSFTLDILESYLERIEGDIRSVKLALPGYSYRAEDFRMRLSEKGIDLVDPLDEWLLSIPRGKREGELRFFWTARNFAFERRVEEIFQSPVRFRTYYNHPWLRGEGQKWKA